MRNIVAIVLTLVIGSAALAQDSQTLNKPVPCMDFDLLVKALTGPKYQEMPVWLGIEASSNTRYSLFVNTSTGDWTLIQFSGKTACILGAGQQSQALKTGPAV